MFGVAATLGVRIPGGYDVPSSCITALPNGANFNASDVASGCAAAGVAQPRVQIYAADVHFKSDAPLTSFTADWIVPPLPASHPFGRSQVVYFWPGFKATEPEMGYPVLQPVLQYGEHGHAWALQSWFVDAKQPKFPVVTAPAIDVQPGHRITSSMALSGDGSTWTVSGTNRDSGEDSTLHIAYSRAGATDYNYAMLVNENINVDTHCDRMPAATGLTFTNVTVNRNATPAWVTRANCAGNPRCDCGNGASVAANGDVTLSWSPSNAVPSPSIAATALPPSLPPLELLPARLRGGGLRADLFGNLSSAAGKEHWLDVPLSWDAPSGASFRLRYAVDETHFDRHSNDGPIFVGMGGEGGGVGGCVSFRTTAVADHKALCVSVEHRFYGESVPKVGGVSTANYKAGLSVEANLHDTAAVIAAVQQAYAPSDGTSRRPVLNFGGSYSGGTCAWMRQLYPNATDGCVSSSGVVNAIANFPEFDAHVAAAAGAECAAALRAAQAAIDAAFADGKGDALKARFNASNLIGTPLGDTDFMYAVADGPAMLVQYGNKKKLCDGLAALPPSPTDAQRIDNLAEVIRERYGPNFAADCFYDSACFGNATATGGGMLSAPNARSWRWQKCSELAYLQSAPWKDALRSPLLTHAKLTQQCDHAFGAGTSAALAAANRAFNFKFGGADPRAAALPTPASSIFYLDFSDDPWAEASVRRALGPALPFCMTTCDGCGHCGAGVPRGESKCYGEADAFVEGVLAAARARVE